MIPVLYSSQETAFVTNGIGRLADASKCHAIEQANGSYELEMNYPVNGLHYSDLLMSNIIFAIPADRKDPQPFRIYNITKPINGIVNVKAEHISYQLSHIPVFPFTADNVATALALLKTNAAEDCPFTFWTDKITSGSIDTDIPKSARSIIGGDEGSILDIYGGELEWDRWTVKLHNKRGRDSGVVLRYGKNITDLEQEESIQDVITGICPYWKGSDEFADNIVVILPEGVLHSEAAANYPYQRTIPVDLSSEFDSVPTEADLRAAGLQYIIDHKIGIPRVSIRVSFAPLWQTEEYKNIASLETVNLFDEVTVYYEKLGVNAKAKVVKTIYDVLNERYVSIDIGETTANLSNGFQSVAEATRQKFVEASSDFTRELERATSIISGVYGGNVVFDRTENGDIYQISVMDNANKDLARNIIRINNEGIGFSNEGRTGTFNSAWLIDGTLDMGQINVLNLTASLLTTGVLQDKTGRNRWNLDTGEFTLQATAVDVGIGGRNYIRKSNTLTFSGYYFGFDFTFNGEQALLNDEEMEVAVG